MGPQTDIEAIQADWEAYQAAVAAIKVGDVLAFRQVNQTLGYNLVKTLPALMELLSRAESDRERLDKYLDKTQERLVATRLEVTQLKALMETERKEQNAAAETERKGQNAAALKGDGNG